MKLTVPEARFLMKLVAEATEKPEQVDPPKLAAKLENEATRLEQAQIAGLSKD